MGAPSLIGAFASGTLDPFPHTWKTVTLPSPPMIAPARSFVFPERVPGEEDALGRGALLLEIRPAQGGTFLAQCALGFRDPSLPTGVWSCPGPDYLLAVAGGYAYWVPTLAPEQTRLLDQRPVVAVVPAPREGLLLLAGFHDVLAVGAEGVRWRSGRLSWEGLSIQSIEEGWLHGTGWDMFADAEVPFRIDLATGEHSGGGYRVAAGSSRP